MISKLVATLIIAISLSSLTGCLEVPCPEALAEIESKPYVDNVYTCLHKSQDYCKALRAAGYEAYVVVGTVTWDERDHAWVEITHEDKVYWCDPTTKSGWYPAKYFTDRILIDSPWASIDHPSNKS